jgi:hypothetical protein
LISSLKTGKAFGNSVDPTAGRTRRQMNTSAAGRSGAGSKGPEFFGNTNFQNEQGIAGRLRHDHQKTISKPDPVIKPKQSSEVQQLLQKDAAKRIPSNNVTNFTPGRPGGDLAALLQKDLGRKLSMSPKEKPVLKRDDSSKSPLQGSPSMVHSPPTLGTPLTKIKSAK